jgi:hypothetical protein
MKKPGRYLVLAGVLGCILLIHSVIWLRLRDCPKPNSYRVGTTLRGRVVGRDLLIVQYRWLRRMFPGREASLSLYKLGTPTAPHHDFVRNVFADDAGNFDFGIIEPGDYELVVRLAGSDYQGEGVQFNVERGGRVDRMVIDASFDHGCTCLGRDVEFP